MPFVTAALQELAPVDGEVVVDKPGKGSFCATGRWQIHLPHLYICRSKFAPALPCAMPPQASKHVTKCLKVSCPVGVWLRLLLGCGVPFLCTAASFHLDLCCAVLCCVALCVMLCCAVQILT